MALDPGIHEHIAGTTIEAVGGTAVTQEAQVAESTDIENSADALFVAKNGFVERRNERCALAPGRNVASAKITDDADAGKLGQKWLGCQSEW